MILLGMISLLQIWFIPGYLLVYRSSSLSRVDKILLAIPLSATVNFFLVYALVLSGFYTQHTMIGIFAVEVAALLFFTWPKLKSSPHRNVSKRIDFNIDLTNIVFSLLVLLCSSQVLNQFGTVFTQGDAVMGWNALAISWFNGIIPTNIAWYPQLLPTLYSLTYQFIADSRVELFAKVAISFYPLFALALFARIAWLFPAERKHILWSAVIFFLLVRRLWGSESTVNGYAELPLAFFCLSILYVFALRANTRIDKNRNTLALVFIGIAIGAGLMKHSGVFLGLIAPFFWLFCFRKSEDWQKHLKHSALIGIAIACGYAPWYLYQYWRITIGIDTSNLEFLSSIVPLPWYESIAFGFKSITYKLSWLWVVLFLAALANRKARYMALFLVLPFFLLWAAFVPYDFRNLAAIFPALAITLSFGWTESIHFFKKFPLPKHSPIIQRGFIFVALAVLSITLLNPKYNSELLRLSDEAKEQIGDPEINNLLFAFFEFHPEPAKVATAYLEMGKVPKLHQRHFKFYCGDNYGTQLSIIESLSSNLSDPTIHYVLLHPWCDTQLLAYFSSRPEEYHAIFQRNGAIFYEIMARHKSP